MAFLSLLGLLHFHLLYFRIALFSGRSQNRVRGIFEVTWTSCLNKPSPVSFLDLFDIYFKPQSGMLNDCPNGTISTQPRRVCRVTPWSSAPEETSAFVKHKNSCKKKRKAPRPHLQSSSRAWSTVVETRAVEEGRGGSTLCGWAVSSVPNKGDLFNTNTHPLSWIPQTFLTE